jgi:hypothetical protein
MGVYRQFFANGMCVLVDAFPPFVSLGRKDKNLALRHYFGGVLCLCLSEYLGHFRECRACVRFRFGGAIDDRRPFASDRSCWLFHNRKKAFMDFSDCFRHDGRGSLLRFQFLVLPTTHCDHLGQPNVRTGKHEPNTDAMDFELERFLHIYSMNLGILLTPFHNMALMSPATAPEDVDSHSKVFREAIRDLMG